jgi:cytochrome b6-f complex iron-sulfur subunit
MDATRTSDSLLPDGTAICASRRAVLIAGGAAGMAALAGCGGAGQGTRGSAQALAASSALARLADIPVGGAISVTDGAGKPVILSQPTAGVIRAFSALCTHKGCKVQPAGKELNCPCHQSNFDAATGAVITGPATSPLPAVAVRVVNGEVVPA